MLNEFHPRNPTTLFGIGQKKYLVALMAAILLLPLTNNAMPAAEPSGMRGTWQEAVRAYQTKDFVSARKNFEIILATGKTHPDLYYNLGNTLYQLGEVGRAAWMYEKTLQVNPRHSQARSNLLLIRKSIQNQRNDGYLAFLGVPFAWLSQQGSANEWFAITGCLYTITCVFFSIWLLLGGNRWSNLVRAVGISSLTITAIATLFAAHRITLQEQHRYGVVIEKGAIVRSAPGQDEPEYFAAQEGERLEVQNAGVRGWAKVKNPADGKTGYLPEKAILRL